MGMFYGDMTPGPNFTGSPASDDSRQRVRELEHQVARLQLMNQALWELVRERAKLTDADLEQKAQEIDLRDGVADGKITNTALKCPSCGRVSSSKHWKCLYCGLEFQKPVMG
ncbi:MAG: hypothetical protein KJ060_09680 [Candidatus Hydrogenedentes bacterium]|nr:hypothetical protein [Candidatus Hydrogenedentota bacterium]